MITSTCSTKQWAPYIVQQVSDRCKLQEQYTSAGIIDNSRKQYNIDTAVALLLTGVPGEQHPCSSVVGRISTRRMLLLRKGAAEVQHRGTKLYIASSVPAAA